MSVKCLTKAQKDLIVFWYQNKIYCQKELAERTNTSERTINRVLVEYGLATPVARIKGEAYHVMQLLKKHGMDLNSLKNLLEPPHVAVVR
jgi:predicted adenine nucleotide alpha hydrolase (AANH) superfamily ATPase